MPARVVPCGFENSNPGKTGLIMKKRLLSIVMFVGVCAVAAGGYHLLHTPPHEEQKPEATAPRTSVVLNEAKMAAAAIKVAPVELQLLQPIRTVPGHIDYNGTRHIAVKSPADGLVYKIAVTVGDHVEGGQLLSMVNSPELGERRADVLKQQAELELAQRDRDWCRSVQTNLEELLSRLKRTQELESLEKDFSDRVLGDYRRDIFSAYSKFRTAEAINTNVKGLVGGVISQRMVLEQASARDSAAATFQAACEQATFDAKQRVVKADAAFADATRRLAVARQRLSFLTGHSADKADDVPAEDSLTTWPVTAPFAATIEELKVAAAERVRMGEDLMVLADTTQLWVTADIRDRDWTALALSHGQKIQVQSPALPDQTLDATIAFIGRTVNPETHATPIVADIANPDRLLKPGMFVRVLLPDGAPYQTLAVPDSAVIRQENRIYVFVETGPREFTPRDVAVGPTVGSWVEIKSGLSSGDRVAVSGVFLLKSELLLEPEE